MNTKQRLIAEVIELLTPTHRKSAEIAAFTMKNVWNSQTLVRNTKEINEAAEIVETAMFHTIRGLQTDVLMEEGTVEVLSAYVTFLKNDGAVELLGATLDAQELDKDARLHLKQNLPVHANFHITKLIEEL